MFPLDDWKPVTPCAPCERNTSFVLFIGSLSPRYYPPTYQLCAKLLMLKLGYDQICDELLGESVKGAVLGVAAYDLRAHRVYFVEDYCRFCTAVIFSFIRSKQAQRQMQVVVEWWRNPPDVFPSRAHCLTASLQTNLMQRSRKTLGGKCSWKHAFLWLDFIVLMDLTDITQYIVMTRWLFERVNHRHSKLLPHHRYLEHRMIKAVRSSWTMRFEANI